MTRWVIYGLAVACTATALLVPWTHYGDIEFGLARLPGWPNYLAGVVVLHVCTWWQAVITRIAALAGGVVAVAMTVVLLVRAGDAAALFDGPVPAVAPALGPGGIFAIAGVLLNGGLVVGLPATAPRPRVGVL
ncbi:hypothetical protein [Lentzea sp. NPDC004782]|uniref:hypothetical protein n=1 Tax=Lentzea sp. NPDC004782 TaxID=3154458 RepID=UPI0033B4E317